MFSFCVNETTGQFLYLTYIYLECNIYYTFIYTTYGCNSVTTITTADQNILYFFFPHTKYIILNSNTIGWIKYFKLVIINGVWGIIIRCLLHCWCNIISRCKLAAPKNPRKWSWGRKQWLGHLMCLCLNISRLCL
jgi:hypothetical protein